MTILLVEKIRDELDPQSLLTLPSWPKCWRTNWHLFPTLLTRKSSTLKMVLQFNLTMANRSLTESKLNFQFILREGSGVLTYVDVFFQVALLYVLEYGQQPQCLGWIEGGHLHPSHHHHIVPAITLIYIYHKYDHHWPPPKHLFCQLYFQLFNNLSASQLIITNNH